MIDQYDLHCQMQEDTSRPLLNEIESLRKQLELMEKAPHWATYTKVCDELAASQEALHAQQICHEHIVAEKDAEIEQLYKSLDENWISHQQLAASQARGRQYKRALEVVNNAGDDEWYPYNPEQAKDAIDEALALPTDTSALEAVVTKAGEVMRERCLDFKISWRSNGIDVVDKSEIRALLPVKLEDLR